MNQTMSLYIPRVFLNITEQQISNIFYQLGYGEVSHVDFVYMDKGPKPYNSVYIYFRTWYNTEAAAHFQQILTGPDQKALIVYENPWYWIVLENNRKNPIYVDEFDKLQSKTVKFAQTNEYDRIYELQETIFRYENIMNYQNELLAYYQQQQPQLIYYY